MLITRGFRSKERNRGPDADRVPPGQSVTIDFPVLTAGPTPRTPLTEWSFALREGDRVLAEWLWDDFEKLPQTEVKVDIHCVTKWSKLDTSWRGVTFDDLLGAAGLDDSPTPFVMAHCDGGYTTNVPVADLIKGRAMIATHYEDLPILPSHGGPARLLVPHLYFWKSAKWVRTLDFIDRDRAGFWEGLGYHNYGDPWREQRYAGDL